MKHKHYEMIVAKAANMGLVVFCKNVVDEWIEQEYAETDVKFSETGFGYFLCLPQHKDACLYWLNGGDVQQSPLDIEQWVTTGNKRDWMNFHSFMQEGLIFKIKPKKEKRWIATLNGWNASQKVFASKQEAVDLLGANSYQFHEIEVEV